LKRATIYFAVVAVVAGFAAYYTVLISEKMV